MKDWSALAAASGIDIPRADIERIVKPLQALEDAFRPLARTLSIADEPAVIIDPAEDAE
jgi:hypothetical protein